MHFPSNPPHLSSRLHSLHAISPDMHSISQWIAGKVSNVGGICGSITAYLLNITPMQIFEVGLYALVGALVGEAVKLVVQFWSKKNKKG